MSHKRATVKRMGVVGWLAMSMVLPAVVASVAWGQAPAAQAELMAAAEDPAGEAPAASEEMLQAEVIKVTGLHAQVSRDGGKKWGPVKVGDKVAEGDVIRTGFGARVEISFADQTVMHVEPLSCVVVSRYSQSATKRTVRAELPYGAVRAGVTHGELEEDTAISTPVSTLSVRGTVVYVAYDAGQRRCLLAVDEDGPAVAKLLASAPCPSCPGGTSVGAGAGAWPQLLYELEEGTYTDCRLSRYLELVSFERAVWVTGSFQMGGVTPNEAKPQVFERCCDVTGTTDGAKEYNQDRQRKTQETAEPIIDFPGGDVPIGDVGVDAAARKTSR